MFANNFASFGLVGACIRWLVLGFDLCKQLCFFQIKARTFSQIGVLAMQSDISSDPRSRSPRGTLSATTLELPGRGEGQIQDDWPPRTPADCGEVRPNAWLTQRRTLPVAAPAA